VILNVEDALWLKDVEYASMFLTKITCNMTKNVLYSQGNNGRIFWNIAPERLASREDSVKKVPKYRILLRRVNTYLKAIAFIAYCLYIR
jgi:hypothetical protein